METNAPTVRAEAPALNYDDPKLIATLKQTVAQGLTDPEFVLFAQHCRSTGLNPFKKEVWAIKAAGRLQVMTGINGYWAIANAHPQFDGYEEDVELNDKGQIVKAWCKVYRKDRKFPSMAVALMAEYKKGTPIWNQMPSVMLLKCAESVALRKAFPQELNGTYTDAEMPGEYAEPSEPTPRPTPPAAAADPVAESPLFAATDAAIRGGTAYEYNIKAWAEQYENVAERNSAWKLMREKHGLRKTGDMVFCAHAVPGWEPFVVFEPAGDTPAADDDVPSDWGDEEPQKAAAPAKAPIVQTADSLDAVKARVRARKNNQQQEANGN